MSAKPITKSQAKLESWGEIRALDRLAVPLIREHGIVEAYRMVVGVDGASNRQRCGGRQQSAQLETI